MKVKVRRWGIKGYSPTVFVVNVNKESRIQEFYTTY